MTRGTRIIWASGDLWGDLPGEVLHVGKDAHGRYIEIRLDRVTISGRSEVHRVHPSQLRRERRRTGGR